MNTASFFTALKPAAAAVALCLLVTSAAQAGPVISTTGVATTASGIFSTQSNLVRWTQADHLTNVSISASLSTFSTTAMGGTAYLMNQVGPGTTVANQIAMASFLFAQVASAIDIVDVGLFSGLDLMAGNYFLVLASSDPVGGFITAGSAATYSLAAGVTVGTPQFAQGAHAFVPAASFTNSSAGNRFFTVTGDQANEIPEPSTLWLGALALTLVGGLRTGRSSSR